MRFAVLSDIHGNLEALQAVLVDARQLGHVAHEHRHLDHIRQRTIQPLELALDVDQALLRLGAYITGADEAVLLVECELTRDPDEPPDFAQLEAERITERDSHTHRVVTGRRSKRNDLHAAS